MNEFGDPPEIYNVDAVAYESMMISMHAIHRGPSNEVCFKTGRPKLTDLEVGYSRDDGLSWSRPHRRGFLSCSRREGEWNSGYLHSSGGVCLVVGEELFFYVGGFSGISPNLGRHLYGGGATGLARLRRDGFASMSGNGELETKLIICDQENLFVNCDAAGGGLRAALVDEDGTELEGYGIEDCDPISEDLVTKQVTWRGNGSVAPFTGRRVSLRFEQQNTDLFAFWFSPSERGESLGFVAAGGPAFAGAQDI